MLHRQEMLMKTYTLLIPVNITNIDSDGEMDLKFREDGYEIILKADDGSEEYFFSQIEFYNEGLTIR